MGIWSRASALAAQTPADRNRYVDFLRAASILFVITGHWLVATAYYDGDTGELHPVALLDIEPWTQWLSWLFQVMPIFFIVGGYSNAVSLESASKRGTDYAGWLAGRLHRLLTPLLVLILVWAGLSFAMHLFGAREETVVFLSRSALVPTWFLAIYTMIVLLAPATYGLWRRYGFASFWAYVVLAILVDVAFFRFDLQWLGWSNYFWVWLAVHHLGFAWRDGRLGGPLRLLLYSLAGLLLLVGLVFPGPYPLAMAGSPGEAVSNTLPPKITLLALGVCQFGLLLAVEKPMQRLLDRAAVWTATVIVNTMIMTVYLWHMTVLVFLLGLSYVSGGIGLTVEPGSSGWWWSRPLWIGVLLLLLLPVALLLSPLERRARPKDAPVPAGARLVGGAIAAGLGIALLTLMGFDGNPLSGFHVGALALVIAGGAVCGLTVRSH